jgi:hypothetical protein
MVFDNICSKVIVSSNLVNLVMNGKNRSCDFENISAEKLGKNIGFLG